ncbi:unannotated protein [freshwater metagenome]|uniref:Unannotated protein n=1 Tax=freshwater metagenome TaxID=449393 RepID=A0A6J7AHG8_9ZZZZ
MTPSSITAICVRSAIWRTSISRSTFSRRAKNSPSVIIVPRLRYGSRYSLRPWRSLRSGRSRRAPRRSLRSGRSVRAGRTGRSRTSRTFTTVTTPSSSTVSPGVTPSLPATRRRRRRCVVPSAESSVPSSVTSSLPAPSLPGLRRPRPPRRRRRLRLARSSASSLVAGASLLTGSVVGASATAAFLRGALATGFSGADWKTGTGTGAAFLRTAFFGSSRTISVASALAEAFFTARLRGVLGSIAMAPNPLCAFSNAYLVKKSPFRFFSPVRAGLLSRRIREPR